MDFMTAGNTVQLSPANRACTVSDNCSGDDRSFDSLMQQEKAYALDYPSHVEGELSEDSLTGDVETSYRSTPADNGATDDEIEDTGSIESDGHEEDDNNDHNSEDLCSGHEIFNLIGGFTAGNNDSTQTALDEAAASGSKYHPVNETKAAELLNQLKSGPKENVVDNTHLNLDSDDNGSMLTGDDDGEEAAVDGKRVSGNAALSGRQTVDADVENDTSAYDEILHNIQKNYEGEQVNGLAEVESREGGDGLNSMLMSDFNDDLNPENRFFRNTFNNRKGQQLSGHESNNDGQVKNAEISGEAVRQPVSVLSGNMLKASGFNELLDSIVYAAKGNNRIGVTVDHEQFGKLNINVRLDRGNVHVHINTTDKSVREFVENNIQQIVDSLNEDGISIGEFSIALKDHGNRDRFEPGFNNSRSGNSRVEETYNEENHGQRGSGAINIFV